MSNVEEVDTWSDFDSGRMGERNRATERVRSMEYLKQYRSY